jgi:hypothetical protein
VWKSLGRVEQRPVFSYDAGAGSPPGNQERSGVEMRCRSGFWRAWALGGLLCWGVFTARGAGPLDSLLGPEEAAPEPTPNQDQPAPPPIPVAPLLVDVPSAERIRQATDLVREAFEELYQRQAAGAAGAGPALVAKLLATAAATKEPDRRFALLNEAQQVAVRAGLVDSAFEAIAAKCGAFRVDGLEERASALQAMAKTAGTDAANLFDRAIEVTTAALDEGCVTVAASAVAAAGDCAKACDRIEKQVAADILRQSQGRKNPPAAKAPEMLDKASGYGKLVAAHQAALAKYEKAESLIQKQPGDAAAHGDVGIYLCLYRENWDEGLSHLARSDREGFRQVAAREVGLTKPPVPAAAFAVAEEWWAFVGQAGQPPVESAAIAGHAAALYQIAVPGLTDPLDIALATKRIAEAEEKAAAVAGDRGIQKIGIRLPPGPYTIEAWCDDRADVYVNEKPVLEKCRMKWQSAKIDVAAGTEIRIAAKCSNFGGPAFFMLVVRDGRGQVVASTAPTQGVWRSYIPPDPAEWWRTDKLRKLETVPRYKGGIWAKGAVRECFLCLKAL